MTARLRIGAGAGFSADRWDPAADLVARGALDVLVFECLAERTIALGQRERLSDPEAGHDPFLEERFAAVLPAALDRGVRIVTNMGAANPQAAGRATRVLAERLGCRPPRVAVVTGDDVTERLRGTLVRLDDGRTMADLGETLVSANAYLGADAVRDGLATGADVVITGRVADPSLFLGAMLHRFGWAPDDWTLLARGTVIGHLLECAGQLTGGYAADPGAFDVAGLETLGFPIAEVAPDGTALLTKLDGTGGRLDRLTARQQLFYEVHDPRAYVTPDVIADMASAVLEPAGPQAVRVSAARGRPRPDGLKVSVCSREGMMAEAMIGYAGPGAQARARLAADVLAHRLDRLGVASSDRRLDLVGMNALHGPAAPASDAEPAEVLLRCAARVGDRRGARLVVQEVQALLTNGPAAGGGEFSRIREIIAVASASIPRAEVPHAVTVLA